MRTATLDVLFKAANAHFHLTALETVSSPGTFCCHVKPRMIPTWSRIKHNPGNLLRCYKIGPFCTASAFGCWRSLHQQYYRSLAYVLAESCSLASFPNGHLHFCHLSPVQVVIPTQEFQQDTRWTESLQHPLYTVTFSHWFPKQQNITTPRSITLNWFLFCLHGAFLPLWNPLPPTNSEFHSKTLNSNLSTFLYFSWLQMRTMSSVLHASYFKVMKKCTSRYCYAP